MIATDIYKPELWNDFFVMVGGGAAALTGLVFVAMSLNLNAVILDATHRYRAIGTLSGFTAIFMLCCLALMGNQNHLTVGFEWLVTSSTAAVIYINGFIQAVKRGGSRSGLSSARTMFGTICYIAQVLGATLLIFDYISGLYLAAIGMIVFFASLISGAWLLLFGVSQEK